MPSWIRRAFRISRSCWMLIVSATTFSGGTSSSSGGGGTPRTSGTFATRRPRPARYVESGVLLVRLTPVDEVGLAQVARLLAVVALHRELDRLDAAEVLLAQRHRRRRAVERRGLEV